MKLDTMKYAYHLLVLLICFSPSFSAEANELHSAVKPVPRSGGWMKRHESFNKRVAEGKVDLILIGDSITHGWEGKGKVFGKSSMVNEMPLILELAVTVLSMSCGDSITAT